jgi:hypothetical protein
MFEGIDEILGLKSVNFYPQIQLLELGPLALRFSIVWHHPMVQPFLLQYLKLNHVKYLECRGRLFWYVYLGLYIHRTEPLK